MRKILSQFLALTITLSLLTLPVPAVDKAPSAWSANIAEHWFYDQLTAGGKDIYNALWDMVQRGMMKDGRTSYDLAEEGVVSQSAILAYLEGDRTLFNDFSAAKDAFDLEHPELWYVDSSYLSFRVAQDAAGRYHAYMGPGRSDNYYVAGVKNAVDVDKKTQELDTVIGSIASGARTIADSLSAEGAAKQVQYVHEQVTKRISYRFETECRSENAGYLRTTYALVTHEGVCESYARSMQLVLNQLGIPCVPVHGLQTSGTPEAHMWNAVQIGGTWYVVDATWDDPVGLDENGNIKVSGRTGLDGNETETYLLVGQDVVGAHWQPSGYVSTGSMEFQYPDISLVSLGGGRIERSGLTVTCADDLMEGTESTVYRVSFNGDGLVESAKKGVYFLMKMYDVNADGSVDEFDDWYYMVHGMHLMGRNAESFNPNDDFRNTTNPYYRDSAAYLTMNVSNAEYVEFAVTTKAPPDWKSAMDLYYLGGYYSGDGSDILAETGLIFNANGGYEQPPYVTNVSPMFNTPVYVGPTYTIHMEFTDPLYHPNQDSIDNAVEGKTNDAPAAMKQEIVLDYTGTTYSWGVNARQPHTFASKPAPKNVRWVCETHGTHSGMIGIDETCRLTTLEFEFSASRMWADDSVQYKFFLTGLVGVKSNKFIRDGGWSYVFENESAYCAYRCKQGIDWNLWGQPQLLDNPNDLDLSKMVTEGVDGKQESLDQLRSQMHLDDNDMNGRLMLVVENIDPRSSRAGELSEAFRGEADIPAGAVLGSSLYEIDFARICQKTIVETGQSLRLSVGFPPGFDASMAGIVFKAYHFTRDESGKVVSVEELPITVTAYGLVILCDSFSPFEIVALDAGMIGEEPTTDKTVMLLADEGGKFLFADGTAAAGEKGVVTLTRGQHVTLKVRPDNGYAVDAVMFDGHPIPVADDGSVVIAYEDIESSACLLSASFISAAVRRADETAGMTPVAPDAGTESSSRVPDRLETAPGTAPGASAETGGSNEPGAPGGSPIPASGTAYANTQMVEIDGKKVEFQMYALIDSVGGLTNYVKVRDLALALNGTRAQFSVDWNGAVNLVAGRAYTVTGTENSTPFSGNRPYTIPVNPTNVNGAASDLTAIFLTDDDDGGYTYYQLRDLGRKLGFNVDWTSERGVFVETDKLYMEK